MGRYQPKVTSTVEARSKEEAIRKLRNKMLPHARKLYTVDRVRLVKVTKVYEVTFRLKKSSKKKRR